LEVVKVLAAPEVVEMEELLEPEPQVQQIPAVVVAGIQALLRQDITVVPESLLFVI
jgi:hypothetical protein